MIAFDTDILVEILIGNARFVERATPLSRPHAVTVVTVEEIVRGRLNSIRQAEAGRGQVTLLRAYDLFRQSLVDFRNLLILPYTLEAELQFESWQQQRVRVGTHDLRIAAICKAHGARLITRNRRDFEKIPDFVAEYWE